MDFLSTLFKSYLMCYFSLCVLYYFAGQTQDATVAFTAVVSKPNLENLGAG